MVLYYERLTSVKYYGYHFSDNWNSMGTKLFLIKSLLSFTIYGKLSQRPRIWICRNITFFLAVITGYYFIPEDKTSVKNR